MSLKTRIAELLAETGKSQADLARICGVSRSAISQWLDGHTKTAKTEYIFKIAEATRYSPKWLALGVGARKDSSRINGQGRVLWELYCQAPEETRKAIALLLKMPLSSGEEQSGER